MIMPIIFIRIRQEYFLDNNDTHYDDCFNACDEKRVGLQASGR